MKDKTKDRVYELICDYTIKFSMSKILTGNAAKIAEQIYVSRSLVSLYLNELYKEGLLLKINTRPVYFLDKKTLSKTFKIYIHSSNFDYVEDLIDLIDTKLLNKGSFIKAIGHDGSLNYCIHQMQSAVKYPGNGLPILLLGNPGCGKLYLAELLAQFCTDEGIIKDNDITVYSPDKNEDGMSISDKLFGFYSQTDHKWNTGLIELCNNGILILKNIQKYDEAALASLISYFKNGYYTVGVKEERHNSLVRIIMTSVPNTLSENWLAKELPIVCRIPDFHERPVKERETIIIDRFLQEQRIVNKKISISKKVFNCLSDHVYHSNFKELQAIVQSLCATSYKEDENALYVKSYHLPDDILNDELKFQEDYDDMNILVNDLNVEYPKNSMFVYFELLLSLYEKLHKSDVKNDIQFMNECRDRMNDYYDYLIYDRNGANSRINAYENVVSQISDNFLDQYQILFSATCMHVLSKVIYNLSCNNGFLQDWQNQNLDKITALKMYFKKNYNHSYYYAEVFTEKIKAMLDIEFDMVDEIFVFLNIYFNNTQLDELKYDCLIIAHGYSTASSISDAVNRMVETRVFTGIDMSINTSFDDTVISIRKYLKRIGGNKDIIILIDMGSLETLDHFALDINGVNIGIIDNVSIKLALDVAVKVKQECELEDIIKTCAKNSICEYKLQLISINKNAIVFTNEAGEAATERVVQLLKESLPKSVGLSIVSYSYENLLLNRNNSSLFDTYNVVLLVGLSEIEGMQVPFISLEDIIAFSDFNLITRAFKQYMNEEEIQILNDNLIKNFSLSSILDNITILNASKLYDELQSAFSLIETTYNVIIPNKIKVGLYIHFSCLIERLVLSQNDRSSNIILDMDDKNLIQFMKTFKQSFKKISTYYKIIIPDQEIYYLCEHLKEYIFS